MPNIDITMLEGRSNDQLRALFQLVTDAVVEALGTPRDEVRITIHPVSAEHAGSGGIRIADRHPASS